MKNKSKMNRRALQNLGGALRVKTNVGLTYVTTLKSDSQAKTSR